MSHSQASSGRRFNYIDTSVWLTAQEDCRPALEGAIRADVVIVGGGYTGLNAALALREAGVDVVLLEMDFCGGGASGRNSGHLAPTMGKDLLSLVKHVGRARATEFMRFNDRSVRHAEETFIKYGIDCDYEATGNITCAVHPRQFARLQRTAELATSLGVKVSLLTEAGMRERKLPQAFKMGVLDPRGGHLNPGKYVLGLRRAVMTQRNLHRSGR